MSGSSTPGLRKSGPPASVPLVAALGLATVDLVQRLDKMPASNEKIWALDASLTFGGPAANAAATAAALGCRARFIGAIGGGPFGRIVAEEMAQAGLEVVDLAGAGFAPAISTVLLPAGGLDRAVVSVNARWAGGLKPLPADLLDGVSALLVDGHLMGPSHELAAVARERGIPVLLDGGSWKPGGIPYLLSLTDIAVVSADFVVPELGPAAGQAEVLEWIAARGPRWVVRSNGADPLTVRWPDGRVETKPIEPVRDVVDTLGAGDVLHGAILSSIARAQPGPGHNLTDAIIDAALVTGIATARRSVATPGARGWIAEARPADQTPG